jgi:8-oxo-dGTP pyrophosphatase MutT (NUDIX family)
MTVDRTAGLYADAVSTLSMWEPPGQEAAAVRERHLTLLSNGPVVMSRTHRAGHLTASVMAVDAGLSRVLLCLHGRLGRWMQLGGHCEPGDLTMAAAALREGTEESGIDGLVLHPEPIDIDIHPVICDGGPSYHYDVRFAALAPPGAVERVSAESRALGWFTTETLPEPLASATGRLVAPALAAAKSISNVG